MVWPWQSGISGLEIRGHDLSGCTLCKVYAWSGESLTHLLAYGLLQVQTGAKPLSLIHAVSKTLHIISILVYYHMVEKL